VKHLTAERLLRLQDRSTTARFHAALDDWEAALATYRRHLQRIAPKLPSGLRRLLTSVSFHDAHVLAIGQGRGRGRGSAFSITLHPQSDPAHLLVLDYTVVEPPRKTMALPQEACSEPVAWLYDELDVVAKRKGHTAPTFLHQILLSNGWEIRLHFSSVAIKRPAALLPCGRGDNGLAAPVLRTG
jgi:hypothetical protein